MGFYKMFDDIKAQAGTGFPAGRGVVGTKEFRKEPGLIFHRDTYSCIANIDAHPIAVFTSSNSDRPSGGRIFVGVGQQVGNNLRELELVGFDRR